MGLRKQSDSGNSGAPSGTSGAPSGAGGQSGGAMSDPLPIRIPSGRVRVYYVAPRTVNTKDGPAERMVVHYEMGGIRYKFFAKRDTAQATLKELAATKLPAECIFAWANGGLDVTLVGQ